MAARQPIRRLLYLLDTCHAAAGGTAIAGQAQALVNNLKAPAVASSVAVLVAARVQESAAPAAFTQAFTAAVDSPANAAGTGGASIPVPGRIDLAIAVTSVAATATGQLIIATELGLIILRLLARSTTGR